MAAEHPQLNAEQRRERAKRWLGEGKSVREIRRLAEAEGWTCSLGWVSGVRQEVMGGPGEPVEGTVARQVQAAGAAAAAAGPQSESLDYGAELSAMYRQARDLARSPDARVQAAGLQQQLRLLEQMRALDLQTRAASGPRIVFYFPERADIARLEAPE